MTREVISQTEQQVEQTPTSHPLSTGILQRKCDCGKGAGLTGRCSECEGKRLTLQRKAVDGAEGATKVPPVVHEVLRTPGQPLRPDISTSMENRFRHDFSQVRIHTNGQASRSAKAINAHAYTVGQDIVFGEGQYNPESTA